MEANGWTLSLLEVGILPMEAADLAPEGVLSSPVRTPVIAVLLRGHGRTILVDAGAGHFATSWPGATDELRARLAAEGATPDVVIITHLDFDHSGGLVSAGESDRLEPAFPGVPVLAPAAAVAEARRDAADEGLAPRVIAALDQAGLVEGYEDGDEPAPGLRLRSAPGHRVGHSILEIGASLVHSADLVHHPLQVEHPSGIGPGMPSPRSRSPHAVRS